MDKDTALINPQRLKADPIISTSALMVMNRQELKRLAECSGAKKSNFSEMFMYDLLQTNEPVPEITMAGPFIGAPQAVLGMEKLIVLGAKKIIAIGWAGSINSNLNIGDIFIPSGFISDEGTSSHYPVKAGVEIKSELTDIILNLFSDKKINIKRGLLWTTDALYRETYHKITQFQALGAVAVDMEFSALATVANFRKIEFASVLIISDELFTFLWKPGFNKKELKGSTALVGDILLKNFGKLKG